MDSGVNNVAISATNQFRSRQRYYFHSRSETSEGAIHDIDLLRGVVVPLEEMV